MNAHIEDPTDAGLILAAEECPPDTFARIHKFTSHDEVIIRKLMAHGPVLIRGGRGSGKSALLIEADRRMSSESSVFPVYVSLRYLPLLQADGEEYIKCFCGLVSQEIASALTRSGIDFAFAVASDQMQLRQSLAELSSTLARRVVLLFDDAAHIGREKPLEVFFDLFRTMSTNLISCKASIYPGVTKFGIRFDVFNDSTVIDISRSDISGQSSFFPEVMRARYPRLQDRDVFSDRLSPDLFANLLGRAVVGNLRGFILACDRFTGVERIGMPEVTRCFLELATDYYWPLMDEVAPKLGVYEPLIEPARRVMEVVAENAARVARDRIRAAAPDRVLVHRELVAHFAKVFEILEYLGFVAKREASRAMKSGGRGPVFALNLCSLLDVVPSRRLTFEMLEEWIEGKSDPAEVHKAGNPFREILLPSLAEERGLAILSKPVRVLAKSRAYPYGLTDDMIGRLEGAGIRTVGELASTPDQRLDDIEMIGQAKITRIRDVQHQAIWM